jgi:VIT1/CCC1 family predicted Fe2+/Mn2+ transporter
MTAQAELLERELEMERLELRRRPESERRELVAIYRSRGVKGETAEELATELMSDPDLALETHAREELGIDPNELGSPWAAALSSFLCFAVGAMVPLVSWFFASSGVATLWSIALGALASLGVGAALAVFTGRSVVRSALRQLFVSALAGSFTYSLGALVGVNVG